MGIRLGLCQTRVTRNKGENLRLAEAALRQAADQGANLALLPEMFNCPYENPCFPSTGSPPGGDLAVPGRHGPGAGAVPGRVSPGYHSGTVRAVNRKPLELLQVKE